VISEPRYGPSYFPPCRMLAPAVARQREDRFLWLAPALDAVARPKFPEVDAYLLLGSRRNNVENAVAPHKNR
jgi:hypothetical protein